MSVNFEKRNKTKIVRSEHLSAYDAAQADMAYDELSELEYHDEPFMVIKGVSVDCVFWLIVQRWG